MTKPIENPKTTEAAAKLVAKLAERNEAAGIVSKQQSKKVTQNAAKQPSEAPKEPSKLAKQESKTVSLANLARELGLDPKVVRAKARRNRDKLTAAVGKTLNEDGWVYDAKQKAKLVAFLTS